MDFKVHPGSTYPSNVLHVGVSGAISGTEESRNCLKKLSCSAIRVKCKDHIICECGILAHFPLEDKEYIRDLRKSDGHGSYQLGNIDRSFKMKSSNSISHKQRPSNEQTNLLCMGKDESDNQVSKKMLMILLSSYTI